MLKLLTLIAFFCATLDGSIIDEHPLFKTAHWGALFADAETGEIVFSHADAQLFIPASLTKLFTTALAMENGKDFHWNTEVTSNAKIEESGILDGSLFLIGGGDPLLTDRDLVELAQQVSKKGVKVITGKVCADNSLWQGETLPIHSEWEDLPFSYACEISSLSLNNNCIEIVVEPNANEGEPAAITIDQKVPYCQVTNHVITIAQGEPSNVISSRGLTDNAIKLEGVVAKNDRSKVSVAIHKPTEYTRAVFQAALENEGIIIQGNDNGKKGDSHLLANFKSLPIINAIAKMNKNSHNLTAAMVANTFKANWNALFEKLGLENFQLCDGTGLSRHNSLTPQQVVRLLAYVQGKPYYEQFVDSLPVAGVDGSLKNRFTEYPHLMIKAKTGSMSSVCNLAGFCQNSAGRKMFFVVMINHGLFSYNELTKILDQMVVEILENSSFR